MRDEVEGALKDVPEEVEVRQSLRQGAEAFGRDLGDDERSLDDRFYEFHRRRFRRTVALGVAEDARAEDDADEKSGRSAHDAAEQDDVARHAEDRRVP